MPPRKSHSGGSAASGRKQTSSIAAAFRPQAKKPTTATAPGKAANLNKSASLEKPVVQSVQSTKTDSSRSQSPEKAKVEGSGLTKDELEKAKSLPELDIHDRRWDGIWKQVKEEKLGKVGPIHAGGQNRIHHILRNFDLDPTYGPCLGMTRLERWTRAKKLGDDPPTEVYEILMSHEGTLKEEYRESCLLPMGV
ncbi:unnamed protein product [Sympodiomycopsis kandeliae]